MFVNPIALRKAKTLWSFGHSECSRVKLSQNYGKYLDRLFAPNDMNMHVLLYRVFAIIIKILVCGQK